MLVQECINRSKQIHRQADDTDSNILRVAARNNYTRLRRILVRL
jgi:hypothetical protein